MKKESQFKIILQGGKLALSTEELVLTQQDSGPRLLLAAEAPPPLFWVLARFFMSTAPGWLHCIAAHFLNKELQRVNRQANQTLCEVVSTGKL